MSCYVCMATVVQGICELLCQHGYSDSGYVSCYVCMATVVQGYVSCYVMHGYSGSGHM